MSPDLEELPIGETLETDPGVVVERRCFLKVATVALASVALPGSAVAKLADSNEPLDFEEFLAITIPLAKKLVSDTSRTGQDLYLHTIAAHAVRLADVPIPQFRDSGQGTGPGTFIGFNPGGDPFIVLHWKMAPGSTVRTHAHTYGNVVTLGLEGAVRQINYEVIGEPDFESTKGFRVRQTQDQYLSAGRTNLLNLKRDYIHGSIATPMGGRGLDITTRLKPRPAHGVPYLELGDPVDAGRTVWQARWTE